MFFSSNFAIAQNNDNQESQQGNNFISEVRNYKRSFIIKETQMTETQQKEFFPLYNEMEEKIYNTNREARKIEQEISSSQEDTDESTYSAAAEALSKVKEKEAEIENFYFEKFAKILTNKQMFLLKRAENRFSIEMLNLNKQSKISKK